MSNCANLKEGDIITCEDCGLELKVVKACDCGDEGDACQDLMQCCGKAMKPKASKPSGCGCCCGS